MLEPAHKTRKQRRSGSPPASRQRSTDPPVLDVCGTRTETSPEGDYDIQHHRRQITAQRNFDKVNFGRWQIKTWYVLDF
jgi:hypothetical protein